MMPYASPYASGVKRDAIDFRAIYEVGDRLLPENLKYDFYQVCNRMYKYYSYIPRDQRKDFDKYLMDLKGVLGFNAMTRQDGH